MRTYRVVWGAVASLVVVLASVATALTLPVGPFLALAGTLAVFGGLLAFSLQDELASVRHPVATGAALAAVPALVPGLEQVAGQAGTLGALALALVSPWVVVRVARTVRARLRPASLVQAGMADRDDALRRQWEESTRQLGRAVTVPDRMVVVRVRQQILDDVAERTDGSLPPFVWDRPDGPGGLDHPTRDGRRPQ